MSDISRFELALRYEREESYERAYKLFHACLNEAGHDRGDLFFHCGWCLEQLGETRWAQALQFYRNAAELATDTGCRMNCHFRSGWILMQQKDYWLASQALAAALRVGDDANRLDEMYQNAAYWYAFCLEAQGRYLQALEWYSLVEKLSPWLNPESRLRRIFCYNRIGAFERAVEVCHSFENPPPPRFDGSRYAVLRSLASREREILEACLADDFMSGRAG